MTAVFIAPLGYPRFCRLLTVGTIRHVTACRASIPADEPVLVTAQRPADRDLCSACGLDLRPRDVRGEDLTPWRGEIGIRADLDVERAAEEMFGPAVSRAVTPRERPVVEIDVDALGGAAEEWEGA